MIYRLEANGDPKPQPRPRAFARAGHARVYDPGTAEGWKASIALAARDAGLAMARLPGPIAVWLEFRFRRPAGHSGKRGLRSSAPAHHLGRPDTDNLAKAVMDCLSQIGAWHDDSVVVDLHVVKRWAEPGEAPGLSATVEMRAEFALRGRQGAIDPPDVPTPCPGPDRAATGNVARKGVR